MSTKYGQHSMLYLVIIYPLHSYMAWHEQGWGNQHFNSQAAYMIVVLV